MCIIYCLSLNLGNSSVKVELHNTNNTEVKKQDLLSCENILKRSLFFCQIHYKFKFVLNMTIMFNFGKNQICSLGLHAIFNLAFGFSISIIKSLIFTLVSNMPFHQPTV
jgi:hypothetical protein